MALRKAGILVFALVLSLVSLTPLAFALVTMTTSPSTIPPNEIVTVTLCTGPPPANPADVLIQLTVTTPSGTVWRFLIPGGDVALPKCPTTYNVAFGDTTAGWVKVSGSGTTQTGELGVYSVSSDSRHCFTCGPEEFRVFNTFQVVKLFGVPEFAAPLAVMTAIGFAGVLLLKRRKQFMTP
jgi:hypothetical protein